MRPFARRHWHDRGLGGRAGIQEIAGAGELIRRRQRGIDAFHAARELIGSGLEIALNDSKPKRKIRCVLIAGGKYHDIDFARLELLKLLAQDERVRVRVFEDYGNTAAIAKRGNMSVVDR